jgi:hypothetical protein
MNTNKDLITPKMTCPAPLYQRQKIRTVFCAAAVQHSNIGALPRTRKTSAILSERALCAPQQMPQRSTARARQFEISIELRHFIDKIRTALPDRTPQPMRQCSN